MCVCVCVCVLLCVHCVRLCSLCACAWVCEADSQFCEDRFAKQNIKMDISLCNRKVKGIRNLFCFFRASTGVKRTKIERWRKCRARLSSPQDAKRFEQRRSERSVGEPLIVGLLSGVMTT